MNRGRKTAKIWSLYRNVYDWKHWEKNWPRLLSVEWATRRRWTRKFWCRLIAQLALISLRFLEQPQPIKRRNWRTRRKRTQVLRQNLQRFIFFLYLMLSFFTHLAHMSLVSFLHLSCIFLVSFLHLSDLWIFHDMLEKMGERCKKDTRKMQVNDRGVIVRNF